LPTVSQVESQAHAEQSLIKEQAALCWEATRRSSFLAEATAVMTRSLDCGATLRGINQAVLPFAAEMSAIVLVDEHLHVAQVEMAWVDAAGQRYTTSSRFAPAPGGLRGIAKVGEPRAGNTLLIGMILPPPLG
jgi:hypothetical protein